MKKIKLVNNEEFEIISSSAECYKCLFQCEIIVDEMKQVKLYCRHPKGPGMPEHCIYFKKKNNKIK